MKLRRAGPTCTARAFLLLIALAVLGFVHSNLWLAQTQLIDTSGQSYYVSARPLLDYPLHHLLRATPEVQGQAVQGGIEDPAGSARSNPPHEARLGASNSESFG